MKRDLTKTGWPSGSACSSSSCRWALSSAWTLLGWAVTTTRVDQSLNALAPVSKAYGAFPGCVSLLLTYVFLLASCWHRRAGTRADVMALRQGLHGRVCARLPCLDPGKLGLHRRHAR